MVTYLHKRPRVERRAADFCCGRGRSRARLHSQGGPGNERRAATGTLLSAQAVSDYYVHWNSPLAAPKSGPLKLGVACDRTPHRSLARRRRVLSLLNESVLLVAA